MNIQQFFLPLTQRSKKLLVPVSLVILVSCGQQNTTPQTGTADTLSEKQRRLSANALKGLAVAEGLEVKLMAAEPTLINPTNIDVDEYGRIWVTEAYNYRPGINGNPTDPKGDRIMILEDKDGDGVAETSTVFYQGPEINAPLGICVLDNRVLVSQSPYVWAFYDDNGDNKSDRKEIIFQGIGGIQHDHGIHSFVAGPDGKLYFTFGNKGESIRDKNNNIVRDQDGDLISTKKYKQGILFRCDPDGSDVECLGYNFRNNYEAAIDSYGTIWQSDNDDDGNRAVRINYVMDYGNFGFTDEMTGASWRTRRTNMEDSIPLQHWHLNDPGVVPNLLQTGSGSPTGMIVYEGKLLPEKFHNQIIHCEPGHNVVRSYPVTGDGAGFRASVENILTGQKDQWFRPVDICSAPDGSLIIADWYDPTLGGHGAGDQQKGRIYRIAPIGSSYKIQRPDYSTALGAVAALQNPNISTRYHASVVLHQMGPKAVPALEQLWRSSADPRMRARAFWILVKMPGGTKYIGQAIDQADANLKIVGLRAARQLHYNLIGFITALVHDSNKQVRRECALALHHNSSTESANLWAELASQYDGKDRWYLEALGIGAADQWDRFFDAYQHRVKDFIRTPAGKDIVWRSRSRKTTALLATLAMDTSENWRSRQKYFRAFDFNAGPEKSKVLISMLAKNTTNDIPLNVLLFHHLDPKTVHASLAADKAFRRLLNTVYGTDDYIELVDQYEFKQEGPRLLELAIQNSGDKIPVEAMRLYFKLLGKNSIEQMIRSGDTVQSLKLVRSIGKTGIPALVDILQELLLSDLYKRSLRLAAAGNIGKSYLGEDRVIQLLQTKQIPSEFIALSIQGLSQGRPDIYKKALTYLPGAAKKISENKNISLADLLPLQTNSIRGRKVFRTNCFICHQVKEEGMNFGPPLTAIGEKLPKEGLLMAIINPSAAISFGFETTEILLKNGTSIKGIIAGRTAAEITIRFPGGAVQTIRQQNIKSVKKLEQSMMPALHESMTRQELADLLYYLSSPAKN
jgi:putative membrane-bound dehydrogenase-like protein